MYDLIRAPRITEKTTLISEHNQITFQVAMTATKQQIKAAVETLFKVRVDGRQHHDPKGKNQTSPQYPRTTCRYQKSLLLLSTQMIVSISLQVFNRTLRWLSKT